MRSAPGHWGATRSASRATNTLVAAEAQCFRRPLQAQIGLARRGRFSFVPGLSGQAYKAFRVTLGCATRSPHTTRQGSGGRSVMIDSGSPCTQEPGHGQQHGETECPQEPGHGQQHRSALVTSKTARGRAPPPGQLAGQSASSPDSELAWSHLHRAPHRVGPQVHQLRYLWTRVSRYRLVRLGGGSRGLKWLMKRSPRPGRTAS